MLILYRSNDIPISALVENNVYGPSTLYCRQISFKRKKLGVKLVKNDKIARKYLEALLAEIGKRVYFDVSRKT